MYCSNCGAYTDDTSAFCTVCGARLMPVQVKSDVPSNERQQTPYVQQTYQNCGNANMPFQKMTEKDFYKNFASKNTNGWVIFVIFSCFLTMAATAGSMIMNENFLSVIDILFYFVFGILLIVKKKWYFTLPVTIYSSIATIITLVLSGSVTGIFAIAAGAVSTVKLKKINDAYKQYTERGIFPQNQI